MDDRLQRGAQRGVSAETALMTVAVKICGVTAPAALEAALAAGAEYVGLVFYPPSPRHVDFEAAAGLAARARGRAEIVVLTVNATDAELQAIMARVAPDLLQLHGSETPSRARAVSQLCGRPVIKAIAVACSEDIEKAGAYWEATKFVLFDAKPRPDQALPGGNGQAFEWSLLARGRYARPFMLSGGLSPENVAEAIRVTGAQAVDVSSGVEERPGVKDEVLIHRFIKAAKAAHVLAT